MTDQPTSVQITMPDGIFVKSMCAGKDGTIMWCIHNISRTGAVEIAEQHQLAEAV
jgi:hypothetical protein